MVPTPGGPATGPPPPPPQAPPSAPGTAGKQQRRGSYKQQSRAYPRGVGLDFRKLGGLSLLSYIDHHGMYGIAEVEGESTVASHGLY